MFRTLIVTALLAVAPAAHAQMPPGLQLASVTPKGEGAFVVADTDSQRFFAVSDAAGPALKKGEAVTVVTRAEGRVRIMVRGQFGWVPEAALANEPPAPEPTDLLIPPG